jgi:hypothetical protein
MNGIKIDKYTRLQIGILLSSHTSSINLMETNVIVHVINIDNSTHHIQCASPKTSPNVSILWNRIYRHRTCVLLS